MTDSEAKVSGGDIVQSNPSVFKQPGVRARNLRKMEAEANEVAEILPPFDGAIDQAAEATQNAAARAVSEVVGKITDHTSDSQKAVISSVNMTVSELGKLAEGMDPEQKLKLAGLIAETGKGSERVNEDNNKTWEKIARIAMGGLTFIGIVVAVVVTKGEILKGPPEA
ncbi:hypothetical protein [Novosphingobium colocasiae]|uniref:hypothetical protein n=1 Tax=Novosphingobium colocasiae TaxID=1256513 RepID=UPI0035B3599C